MQTDTPPRPGATSPSSQFAARLALGIALVAFGLWILHDFFPALAWAGVLAIALWPLYQHLQTLLPNPHAAIGAPLLATAVVTLVVIAPLVLLGIAVARESHVVIGFIGEARHHGVPVPDWVMQLPLAGPTIAQWWTENLSDPAVAEELIGRNM